MAEQEINVNTNPTETAQQAFPGQEAENNEQETNDNAEIARLKADLARTKAAMDKAAKEAAESKRMLRAKQTAEEAAAEAERERQEAIEKELADLRKEKAVANASKRVMTFVQDENVATGIAEALYGAADIDLAIDAIARAWTAREKALRIEFGKIPAPSVGGADGPTITKAQLDGMGYKDRLEFANAHPDEYNKLMGR